MYYVAGGLVDAEDQTIVDAGLRELEEETGIKGSEVQVLGKSIIVLACRLLCRVSFCVSESKRILS